MPAIKQSQPNPSPEIEYGELIIPDDKNLGNGKFINVLKSGVLSSGNPFMSIMINIPVFQISVNINPQTNLIPVLLGKADNSDPVSRKTFIIPKKLNKSKRLTLVTNFNDWKITTMTIDGITLLEN